MKPGHRRRGLACAAIEGAALLGVATTPSAQAATLSSTVASLPRHGIPALVNTDADLAAQTPGPETTWVDSIFLAGRVHGGGHNFGILVQTLAFPNADQRTFFVGITDTSTGWYHSYEAPNIPKDQYTWSRTGLQISMPGLTWAGSAQQMQVKVATPWGSLVAQFVRKGPVLNYSGNGLVPLLGDVDYEYAFPAMRTAGTLTAEGRTVSVFGTSWLDRQWGPIPVEDASMRWTWMNIRLSNGDQLALWDILDNTAENSWVTVLHPDGSYALAAVRPLATGDSGFWTSPLTHKTYPTRWRIQIPALHSLLSVIVSPKGQELPNGRVEATAAVNGSYLGEQVIGTTYVEMTGNWTTGSPSKSGLRQTGSSDAGSLTSFAAIDVGHGAKTSLLPTEPPL